MPRPAPASTTAQPAAARPPRAGGALLALFAAAAGLAVGNAYAVQPLLDEIADDLAIERAAVGGLVTATQVGLAAGLLLVVPLGDALPRRRLLRAQVAAAVAALALVAAAPGLPLLLVGMAAVGASSVLAPYAAALAPPERRGRAVGVVTGGVITGILLSRAVAGALATAGGWRAVYAASALLTAGVGMVLLRALPREDERRSALPYRRLVASVATTLARSPLLRARGLLAFLAFASFSTLWTALALPLSEPPRSLSPAAIGLFGLAGAAGAAAALRAGRLADRGLAGPATGGALLVLLASWAPIAALDRSLVVLAVGVVLLDLAVQAVHVTNQSLILAALPDAAGRATAAYMLFYSAGSAAGAIGATAVYAAAGWGAVCAQGAALALLGLGAWAATRRTAASPAPGAREI